MTPEEHPIHRVIRGRRSVKPAMMSQRPVDRETLEWLLENANWAPTHGLTQPWRFVVFQGEGRRALAEELRRLYQMHTPAEAFRPDKFDKLGAAPLQASAVAALGMVRDPRGKICELDEIAAVACAAQNVFLSATAVGLAMHWSSPPVIHTAEMNVFLGLGQADKCLGLLYLGWPRDGVSVTSTRAPIADRVVWRTQ